MYSFSYHRLPETVMSAIIALSGMCWGAVTFDTLPYTYQLFPRDSADSATLIVSGSVTGASYDSMAVELYKNGSLIGRAAAKLEYNSGSASFRFSHRIAAQCAQHRIDVLADGDTVIRRDSIVCGDVFLINGQSNAQAPNFHGESDLPQSEWVRTYGTGSSTIDMYDSLVAVDTFWVIPDAGSRAFPGIWGVQMGKMIADSFGIPVCILNQAIGSGIKNHLRNDDNRFDLSTIYGRLLYRAAKAGVQNHAKAMLWYQGESNTSIDYYDYASSFSLLHAAWKSDYPGLSHFYVFQLHPVSCGGEFQSQLRDIQRRLPESYDHVSVMSAAGAGGQDGCHYYRDGYVALANRIWPLVASDFYGYADTIEITAPSIVAARYSSADHLYIDLIFDCPVVWPADTLGASMSRYFFLDGRAGKVDTGVVVDDSIITLYLKEPYVASAVSYLPNNAYYENPNIIYQGPWIRNRRGIGALSFHNIAIDDLPVSNAQAPFARSYGAHVTVAADGNALILRLRLQSASCMRASIFDIRGRCAAITALEDIAAGTHEVRMDIGYLGAGAYFACIEINGTRNFLPINFNCSHTAPEFTVLPGNK